MGYTFSVFQDGLKVACGWASSERSARGQAHHYAVMYGQDGPVAWSIRHGRKTLERGTRLTSPLIQKEVSLG